MPETWHTRTSLPELLGGEAGAVPLCLALLDHRKHRIGHRYKRRWLVERLFAWLMRSRRLVTR